MNTSFISSQLELLQKSVESLTSSKEYQQFLKTMSRFPSYSPRNQLLIFAQKPDSTLVAGFCAWRDQFGRHVKKGEKGIRILAPYTFSKEVCKNGVTRKEKRTGFRSIKVFDISQTEGKPLPVLPPVLPLEGECENLPKLSQALEDLNGYQIVWSNLQDSNGVCSYDKHQIQLNNELSTAHQFKCLLHETAHALLHDPDQLGESEMEQKLLLDRSLREIEAESTSFVVASALGVDCSSFSFPYIAQWKLDTQFVQESIPRISSVSARMIQVLEPLISNPA